MPSNKSRISSLKSLKMTEYFYSMKSYTREAYFFESFDNFYANTLLSKKTSE